MHLCVCVCVSLCMCASVYGGWGRVGGTGKWNMLQGWGPHFGPVLIVCSVCVCMLLCVCACMCEYMCASVCVHRCVCMCVPAYVCLWGCGTCCGGCGPHFGPVLNEGSTFCLVLIEGFHCLIWSY